jgi:hypothetical protein
MDLARVIHSFCGKVVEIARSGNAKNRKSLEIRRFAQKFVICK